MSEFKYQLHCHTSPCSACGRITPYELVKSLYESGYKGAVLTNHFINGNSGIDRSLTWKKFVSFYEKDYLDCKAFAEKLGIDILFGVEEGVGNGQEILCYGLTPEMLYTHPELKKRDSELWYKTLSPLGVVIIQAHPFRVRNYISDIGVLPAQFIDGIEVYNFCNSPDENKLAEEFSESNRRMILTSGADAHFSHILSHGGIIVNERIDTPEKLSAVLKNGNYKIIKK